MGPKSTRPFFSFLVHRAEDLPGTWVAHCLELGLVSQGDSMLDAVECIGEATEMVLAEADVRLYQRSPADDWNRFLSVVTQGIRIDLRRAREEGKPEQEADLVLAGYRPGTSPPAWGWWAPASQASEPNAESAPGGCLLGASSWE